MPDKIYTYHGPLSAVTLAADDKHPAGRDVQLMPGQTVTLPAGNDYVRSLVARKYLVPVVEADTAPASASAAPAKPAPAESVKPATATPTASAENTPTGA